MTEKFDAGALCAIAAKHAAAYREPESAFGKVFGLDFAKGPDVTALVKLQREVGGAINEITGCQEIGLDEIRYTQTAVAIEMQAKSSFQRIKDVLAKMKLAALPPHDLILRPHPRTLRVLMADMVAYQEGEVWRRAGANWRRVKREANKARRLFLRGYPR